MKIIILAAGYGSRLKPITNELPKCMVEVNGTKIIEKQIKNLINNGIDLNDIIIVTGYKTEVLEKYIKNNYYGVNIIVNKDYETTNNMYSLFLTQKNIIDNEIILMNGDVFYEAKVIADLLRDNRKNLIVCEKGKYIEESMKIIKNNNKIEEISKMIQADNSYGVTIDVYKLSKDATNNLLKIMKKIIKEEKKVNLWTEVALNILLKEVDFDSLDMQYKWVEIDNLDDLKLAEELFA